MRSAGLLLVAIVLALGARPGTAQVPRRFKVNAPSTLLGVPQLGVEWETGPATSVQLDVTASLWRSVGHAPAQFLIVVPEWRRHLRDGHVGPYIGLHAGLVGFRLQKWDWRHTEFYQEGVGAVFGLTAGYQRAVSDRLVLDAFLGGGTAQTKYKGYSLVTGERYDGEEGWNESGEWAPYRAGLMLSYRWR